MQLSDTAWPILELSPEIARRMTGEERILWTLEASHWVREFVRAGIRSRHPDWNEAQVFHELLRRVFLPDPLPPGVSKWIEELHRQGKLPGAMQSAETAE